MPAKILGLPFDDYVKGQVEKRQDRLSQLQKSSTDLVVFNASTSWIKLTSGVDLKSEVTIDGISIETERVKNSANILGVNEGDINGANLAKRAVLFGGILYNEPSGSSLIEHSPLGGVKSSFGKSIWDSAYGYLSKNNDVDYGLKPMPGVTDVHITYKNNGTLKQAQVKLVAHSLPQFQAIELLYLRLGYTMLLEWGHTDFYNNNGQHVQITSTLSDEFLLGNYNNNYLKLVDDIENQRISYAGNYDGMYAKVSNYSWTLNNNLGYDITIDLISLGDVIDSLKFNSQSSYTSDLVQTDTINFPIQGLTNIDLNKGVSGFNAFLYEVRQFVLSNQNIDSFIAASSTTSEQDKIFEELKQQNQAAAQLDIYNTNITNIKNYVKQYIVDLGWSDLKKVIDDWNSRDPKQVQIWTTWVNNIYNNNDLLKKIAEGNSSSSPEDPRTSTFNEAIIAWKFATTIGSLDRPSEFNNTIDTEFEDNLQAALDALSTLKNPLLVANSSPSVYNSF